MELTKRPSLTSALNVTEATSSKKEEVADLKTKETAPPLLDQIKSIKDALKSALDEIDQSQKEFGRVSGLLEAKLDKIVR